MVNDLMQDLADDLSVVDTMLEQSLDKVHWFIQRALELQRCDVPTAQSHIKRMIEQAQQVATEDAAQAPIAHPVNWIPKTIHRIWLTDPESPVEPPARYIDKLIADAGTYKSEGWSHYLWVQDERLIPATRQKIIAADAGISLMAIESRLSLAGPWAELYNAFLRDRKFPFASDILRMKILHDFGGVYADMGARFRNVALANLIAARFDHAFIFWETMFFQNSLMAMPSHSAIARVYMRIVNNPYSIPGVFFPHLDGIWEGMAFSGLLVTAALLASEDRSVRICPLAPNGKLIEWESEKSWYTQAEGDSGKFGNAYVPATGASFLQSELLGSVPADRIFTASTPA